MTNDNDKIILRLENVSRTVSKNGDHLNIIDSISYNFERGKLYNIVGPSGSGKSSFLRLLNRLDETTGGDIYFENENIRSLIPTEYRKNVNLLFQTPYLFSGTVSENIDFCCDNPNVEQYKTLLEKVGLDSSFAAKDALDLSVGQKQRVALARSLALGPRALLLDEPTSALDPGTSQKIEGLILSLLEEFNLTVIIVTHNPNQALRLGGETLLIVKGKLIESGHTQDLLVNPTTELGKKYINKEML